MHLHERSSKKHFKIVDRMSINDLKKYKIPIPSDEIVLKIIEEYTATKKVIEDNKNLIETFTKKINKVISNLYNK